MKIDNNKQVVLLNNLTKPSSTNGGKGAGSDGSQTVTDSGDKVDSPAGRAGWRT